MFSRPSFFALGAAALLGAAVVFSPGVAHATLLSACGNIDLSGSESCTLETSGGCTVNCTPVNFQLSCSAQLEASCSGGCSGSIEASCTSSCTTDCSASCTANPGSFSCSGNCESDCSGHCQAQCASDANQSECTASCTETCGAQCNASCQGTPPTASCTAQCTSSCQGSCQAQANLSCQVTCQEQGYATCESQLSGGCTSACSAPQGALFCNGQWVNVDQSQLQDCENQLASLLNIQVSASGSCSGDTCTGQATASCGQIAPGAMPMGEGVLALGLGLGVAGAARRRIRRNAKK